MSKYRKPISKNKSKKIFTKNAKKYHKQNMPSMMRGGIRL